jgi:uncharacterized protein
MPETEWPLVLMGVFRALRARGTPLGVPDYLAAIAALRQGYPWCGSEAPPPSREDLRGLCSMLWARDDAEARLVNEIFERIPAASRRYEQDVAEAGGAPPIAEITEAAVGLGGSGALGLEPTHDETGARISFTSRREDRGLDLPRLVDVGGLEDQTYVLEPESVLSPRSLAVLFRRFRARVRTGARTELDLSGTIKTRYQCGVATSVVFRSPLVSRARMTILADISTSMSPWRPFLCALAEGLALSRLASVRLAYFGNVPDDLVYASPDLTHAIPFDDLLAAAPSAPVLLISDAGAARGTVHPGRVRTSLALLERFAAERRQVAWLNPMPRQRWPGTSAGVIASRSRSTTFVALDPRGQELLRAIDILRGTRQARS